MVCQRIPFNTLYYFWEVIYIYIYLYIKNTESADGQNQVVVCELGRGLGWMSGHEEWDNNYGTHQSILLTRCNY